MAPPGFGGFPALYAGEVSLLARQCNPVGHDGAQEPRKPDRFATPAVTHTVHAVVPVAAAHQGQSMHADPQAVVNGARSVLIHTRGGGARMGRFVHVFCTFRNGRSLQKRHLFVQQCAVGRALQIVRAGKGQPQQIVGKMRSHPCPARTVPPVLHIARLELP